MIRPPVVVNCCSSKLGSYPFTEIWEVGLLSSLIRFQKAPRSLRKIFLHLKTGNWLLRFIYLFTLFTLFTSQGQRTNFAYQVF